MPPPAQPRTYSFASAGPARADSDASTSRVDARPAISSRVSRSGSNGWDDRTAWATEDSDGESPTLAPSKQLSALKLSTGPSLPSTTPYPSPASSGPRSPSRSTSASLWDVIRGRTTSADAGPRTRPSPASSVAPLPSPMMIRPARDTGPSTALAGSAGSNGSGSGQWILLPADDADGPSRPPPMTREAMLEALRSDAADLVASASMRTVARADCSDPTEALRRLHVSDDGTFFKGLACPMPGDDAPVASTSKAPPLSPFLASGPSRPQTPSRPDVPGESAASASARREARRKDKFLHCLRQDNVDMGASLARLPR